MDRLPGCCFVEESCEALLSRMASRCRSHVTLSSFEGVSDLFLTLPPPSRTLKKSRGTLKQGLVHLVWMRSRKLIARAESLPFATWSAKVCTFEQTIPDGFRFPEPLLEMSSELLEGVLTSSLRSLRSKAKVSDELKSFLDQNVPRVSPMEPRAVQIRQPRIPRAQNAPPSSNTFLFTRFSVFDHQNDLLMYLRLFGVPCFATFEMISTFANLTVFFVGNSDSCMLLLISLMLSHGLA